LLASFVGLNGSTPATLEQLRRIHKLERIHIITPPPARMRRTDEGSSPFSVLAVRKGECYQHPTEAGSSAVTSISVLESEYVPFEDTIMERGFCFARVGIDMGSSKAIRRNSGERDTHQHQLLVVCTELESCRGRYTGTYQRCSQLLQLKQFFQRQMMKTAKDSGSVLHACILLGDFRWDDAYKNGRSIGSEIDASNVPRSGIRMEHILGRNLPSIDCWNNRPNPSPRSGGRSLLFWSNPWDPTEISSVDCRDEVAILSGKAIALPDVHLTKRVSTLHLKQGSRSNV